MPEKITPDITITSDGTLYGTRILGPGGVPLHWVKTVQWQATAGANLSPPGQVTLTFYDPVMDLVGPRTMVDQDDLQRQLAIIEWQLARLPEIAAEIRSLLVPPLEISI